MSPVARHHSIANALTAVAGRPVLRYQGRVPLLRHPEVRQYLVLVLFRRQEERFVPRERIDLLLHSVFHKGDGLHMLQHKFGALVPREVLLGLAIAAAFF